MKKITGLILFLASTLLLASCTSAAQEEHSKSASCTHSLTHIERKESTCVEHGNIEYYYCSNCLKFFADSQANEEINANDISLPLSSHTMTYCEAVAHTCIEDGILEHYHCSVCDKDYADIDGNTPLESIVDKTPGHAYVKHEAVEPTYELEGNIEYYSCENCSELFIFENEDYVSATWDEIVIPKLVLLNKTSFEFDELAGEGPIEVSSLNGTQYEIVDDSDAHDSKALRASQQISNSDLSGVKLTLATPIEIEDYSHINVYVKTESLVHTGFYINENKQVYNWGAYDSFTAVDIKPFVQANGESIISSFIVGDTDRTGYWYIDRIELVELVHHNFDFSSLDDNDADMMSSYGGFTLSGIVGDADASNGFAYKFTTPAVTWGENRAVLTLDNAISPSDYRAIILVVKVTVTQVCICADDVYSAGTFVLPEGKDGYQEINLLSSAYISALSSISHIYFAAGCVNQAVEFYLDKIVFVEKSELDYDFSGPSDADKYAVTTSSGVFVTHGIESVEGATDGYAYHFSIDETDWNHYAYVNFDNDIVIEEYSSIVIRIKVDVADCWIGILLDGRIENDPTYGNTFLPVFGTTEWVEIDLLEHPYFASLSSFKQLTFVHGNKVAGDFYVDRIVFSNK